MRRKSFAFAATLLCASAAHAQMATDSHRGEFSLGVSQTDSNTTSSKFLEYRDIPNGLFAPHFRFQGEKSALRYDIWGINVRQKDQAFKGFVENDTLRLEASYNQIPHSFGNEGKTLLENTSLGVWQMSDTLQRTFQTAIGAVPDANYNFLNALVTPSYAAANTVDLRLTRERGNVSLSFKPDPVDVKVTYFHERRVGSRSASGTAFGFSTVVELPEALHYLTQDFGADAALNRDWGSVRASAHYNWFENRAASFVWDNPFRATDAVDNPADGRMALPPENTAFTGSAGATIKFGKKSRLIADASFASWKQDQTPFIPYTANSAVVGINSNGTTFDPTVTSTLPAAQLAGKADVTSFNATFHSRPSALFFTVRYRYYDLANDTPQLSFPGYVSFDLSWKTTGRRSVPYGFTTNYLDAIVGYDFGNATVDVGYKGSSMDRTYRETEKTRQNGFVANLNYRGSGPVALRAGYEFAARDYDGVDMLLSEEASFITPGAPTNLLAIPNSPAYAATYSSMCGTGPLCNMRYDQAKKDTSRLFGFLDFSPGNGKTTVSLGYAYQDEDYKESKYGLTRAKFSTYNAEVNFDATDKATLYAFYSYEDIKNAQRGRQSGSTPSVNALDDWTSDTQDKVNSLGAGADFVLKPEKWWLKLVTRWQKVDGNNNIDAPPGGVPANNRASVGGVQDITAYDDTKIFAINGELKYQFAKAWSATLGGYFEDYQIRDANTQDLRNYAPSSFFLAYNDGDYKAAVGYIRVTYRW
jgi:MtrB/PioB family decaheme-associated outer membrane protein